jgi:phosphate transport system protein
MESKFHSDLEQLQMIILQMATLTEEALEKSIKALMARDNSLADDVVSGDKEIDLLEVEVDRHSLRLLALDQPMARDLRFIIGCMRIAVAFERIGDEALHVAQRARFLNSRPSLPTNHAIEELASTALGMLRSVISSFVNHNSDLATDVCKMDDVADELNYRILKDFLAFMTTGTPVVERSVQTILVARCFERIADQTTNIAESVIFMDKGVNIKHRVQQ